MNYYINSKILVLFDDIIPNQDAVKLYTHMRTKFATIHLNDNDKFQVIGDRRNTDYNSDSSRYRNTVKLLKQIIPTDKYNTDNEE